MSRLRKTPIVCGILVAAGSGQRMLGINKQLYCIDGLPVIAHTINSFLDCPEIKELIIVCREEERAEFTRIAGEYMGGMSYQVVAGSATRQGSVFCGIHAADERTEFYAIHDGARPLVKSEEISDCIALAVKTGAATLGVPVKDTIKVVKEEIIQSTPNRDELYMIQTPQIFEAKLYRRAMEQALKQGAEYTDDCQLVEQMGRQVHISKGSYENIKITTREDVCLAEAILEYRKEGL